MNQIKYSQLRDIIATPYLLDISRYGVTAKTISVFDVEEEDCLVKKFGNMNVLWVEPNIQGYLLVTIEEPYCYDK